MSPRELSDYPPMMDTTMVADFLQMSPVHVRRLARDGVIPAYRIDGVRAFRFKRDEVSAWFEGQKVAPAELEVQEQALAEVYSNGEGSDGASSSGGSDPEGFNRKP